MKPNSLIKKVLGFTWWRHALKCKQSEDDFQRKWSSIHKVTIK